MIYDYTIYPIECIYKVIYLCFYSLVDSYGLALILLSVFTSCITHPLMKWAGNISKDEKEVQKYLTPQLEKIKAELSGAEQHHAIQRLYKRYGYHPVMAVRSAIGVILQLPFLMAAYYMLSNLEAIKGISWLIFKDLGQPDALVAGFNVMPFVMTIVNLLSAYTTAGFTRRDKLQAFAIAGMFLVLLYNAPSALLIYWTFNNLWTLLGNLYNKYEFPQYICCKEVKNLFSLYGNLPVELKISYALVLMVGILIPLDIYVANINDFWFKISDLFLLLGVVTAVLIVVSTGIYFLFAKVNLSRFYLLCVFWIFVSVFLQSYVINFDYGVLDGKEIRWDKYSSIAIENTLVWMFIGLILFIVVKRVDYEKFKNKLSKLCTLLVLIQIASLIYTSEKNNLFEKINRPNIVVTTNNMWEFSNKSNIIILILDTFDSSYMKRLLEGKDGQEYKSILRDFTYYPDTLGAYPTTKGAMPFILTGKWYHNEIPYSDYVAKSYEQNKIYDSLKDRNFDISVYTDGGFLSSEKKLYTNVEFDEFIIKDKWGFLKDYYRLTMFKLVPHVLKKNFFSSSDVFNRYRSANGREVYNNDTQLFFKNMKKSSVSINNNQMCFKVYHLAGTHEPFTFDKNLNSNKEIKYSAIDEASGCLTLLNSFLNKLKGKNLYDNSSIIVMADHGGIQKSQNPLFMIKSHKQDAFRISDLPLSYDMLDEIYLGLISGKIINDKFIEGVKNDKVRKFNYYSWGDFWGIEYLPSIKEYVLQGHANDEKNLIETGNIFADKMVLNNDYRIGEKIIFSNKEVSRKYCYIGFSGTEKFGRWTDGNEAIIKLNISNATNNLKLKLKYFTFNGKQSVSVFVNNKLLSSYIANGSEEKTFEIPKALINDGLMEVKFLLPDAKSPFSLGMSTDQRKLALAMQEVVIY